MIKTAFVILMASIVLIAPMSGPAGAGDYDAAIYTEDLRDDDGYNYGVVFYIDNATDAELYVVVVITHKENVAGNVFNGILLLEPYEKGALIGSFIAVDIGEPWGANIRAYWAPCPEDLEIPPQ
jgi:methyl coenzyme M reductase alpha subunit